MVPWASTQVIGFMNYLQREGFVAVNQPSGKTLLRTHSLLALFCSFKLLPLLPSPSSPCLPWRQLTILHMFCDIPHISSWINDLCWLCLTLVQTWPSIMPVALTAGSCVFIIPDCRSQWVPSPGSAPAPRVCAAGQ